MPSWPSGASGALDSSEKHSAMHGKRLEGLSSCASLFLGAPGRDWTPWIIGTPPRTWPRAQRAFADTSRIMRRFASPRRPLR